MQANCVIWKYPLRIKDVNFVKMPEGAKVLSVAIQNGTLCLWAMVDTSQIIKERAFKIIGTGHPINFDDPASELSFIGTVIDGQFVWHVFELL